MNTQTNAPVLYIPSENSVERLPDNKQWQFRFEIPSGTTDNLYTIAQHKTGKWWACSCRGWISHKHCWHLKSLGIPGNYTPYEPKIIEQ